MSFSGACHCGTVRVDYRTETPVRLRQDGCGFCSSRGVKSASDPHGELKIVSQRRLLRYQFGHKTANFLLCPGCGTYVAAVMQGPDGCVGVLNVVGVDIAAFRESPVDFASLDGESVDDRIQRRLSRWTPTTLSEPGQDVIEEA